MTFICFGDSHVAKPFTLVQLMGICSFVEELFLAKQIPEEPEKSRGGATPPFI